MIKEIENHSGYVASDQGLIFRKTKDGLRELKPSIVGKYPVVQLGRRTYYVHRIIANLFVFNDDPIGRLLIFHIDGDPSNNSFPVILSGNFQEKRFLYVLHGFQNTEFIISGNVLLITALSD